MSTSQPEYQPLLHRVALVTTCVALCTVVIGAITTTLGAGMAFPDWPSSDGHNMFFYPWLRSAGDKFLEHGHRLAGIAIGLCSIALTVVLWMREDRLGVTLAGVAVLLSVILQGILGGMRVLANDPRLAMVHGSFAALVFSLMAAIALWTSRSWLRQKQNVITQDLSYLKPWAVAISCLIFGQYILGGILRHLGGTLHEHIAAAVLVLLFAIALAVATHRTGISWLKRPAYLLLGIIVVQIGLGMMAFVMKFGFAPTAYVAVQDSLPQTISRTVHTIMGMLVLMTSIIYTLRVFYLDGLRQQSVALNPNTDHLIGSCSVGRGAQ